MRVGQAGRAAVFSSRDVAQCQDLLIELDKIRDEENLITRVSVEVSVSTFEGKNIRRKSLAFNSEQEILPSTV